MTLRIVQDFLYAHPTTIQILFYATFLTALWIAEYKLTGQHIASKLKHTAFNSALLLLALPAQLAMTTIVLALAHWCTEWKVGLLYALPFHDSAWVKYGVMFLLLDFLDYSYHYAAHRVPWLWRLHLVHHSDRNVDVSTTFREHPLETLVRTGVLCAWVLLCGASLPLLVLRQSFETIANVAQHSRLGIPEHWAKWLQYVFVTPDLHHAHHHARLPGTDCNYGDVLSFWDRLFGTRISLHREDIEFGIDTHIHQDSDLLGLLALKTPRRIIAPVHPGSTDPRT